MLTILINNERINFRPNKSYKSKRVLIVKTAPKPKKGFGAVLFQVGGWGEQIQTALVIKPLFFIKVQMVVSS